MCELSGRVDGWVAEDGCRGGTCGLGGWVDGWVAEGGCKGGMCWFDGWMRGARHLTPHHARHGQPVVDAWMGARGVHVGWVRGWVDVYAGGIKQVTSMHDKTFQTCLPSV